MRLGRPTEAGVVLAHRPAAMRQQEQLRCVSSEGLTHQQTYPRNRRHVRLRLAHCCVHHHAEWDGQRKACGSRSNDKRSTASGHSLIPFATQATSRCVEPSDTHGDQRHHCVGKGDPQTLLANSAAPSRSTWTSMCRWRGWMGCQSHERRRTNGPIVATVGLSSMMAHTHM
jgi:hypothetical protein